MARQHKIHRVFETSAKTGYNVEEVFALVARELYQQAKEEQEKQPLLPTTTVTPTTVTLTGEDGKGKGKGGQDGKTKKKSGCC